MSTPSSALLHLTSHILKTLIQPSPPPCPLPPNTHPLLFTNPSALLSLAHSKLHTYPYASVPTCWRQLFVDASVLVACGLIRDALLGEKSGDEGENVGEGRGDGGNDEEGEWVGEVVRVLDMALLMAGGVGREEIIEGVLEGLESVVGDGEEWGGDEEWGEESFREIKRRKIESGAISADILPITTNPNSDKQQQQQQQQEPPDLPPSTPKIHFPIPHLSHPSLSTFQSHTHSPATPLIITNSLNHWPCLQKHGPRAWSRPGYLLSRTFGGRRLVPVELGRSYTDEGWGQKIMTFGEFLGGLGEGEGRGGEAGEGKKSGDEDRIGYLAQHDLFAQIPALRNDISIPDYCFTNPPKAAPLPMASMSGASAKEVPQLEEPLLNAWFGPAGTVSPLHTDPYHNMLCQVVGKKYVRLYSPDQGEDMYPRGVEGGGVDMSNTSEVDVEGEGVGERYPRFVGATYVETVLGEGECLYIPLGWWHYVRSLTVSFSVSFWWN